MRKLFTLLGLLFILPSAVKTQDLKLEEVLSNYYKASAFDKYQKVITIVSAGTLVQQDRMPIKTIRLRPDKFLQVYDVADITCYSAYDGKTAWMQVPYTGNPRPQLMTEDQAKDVKVKADFDGLLYNWKDKVQMMELAGNDTIDNALAYRIKVVRKDGGIEFYSIGKNSFLLLKRQYTRIVRGKEMKMEVFYRAYKKVEGIPFAFTVDNRLGGQDLNSVQLDSIILNGPMDKKVFEMPPK
jgi:hypothetical protein